MLLVTKPVGGLEGPWPSWPRLAAVSPQVVGGQGLQHARFALVIHEVFTVLACDSLDLHYGYTCKDTKVLYRNN